MLLAIDVGNTNIVFAICEGEDIRWRWRISTDGDRTADEYAVWLHQLMALEGVDGKHIDAAIIATVVPPTLFNLQRLCRKYFGIEALVVGGAMDFGLAIDLPNPAEAGADRIVNAVAARAGWAGALIVVDFGTATTFDVVVGEAYVGGVIAPGINLSMDALYRAAAKLPRIAVEPPEDGPDGQKRGVIGRGTVHAMQSGVFWGYVGLIEGLVARIRAELGVPATVIATGGLATLFQRHCPVIDAVDGDLTIKGLMRLNQRNAGNMNMKRD
jgi:type III pantothenate kinase